MRMKKIVDIVRKCFADVIMAIAMWIIVVSIACYVCCYRACIILCCAGECVCVCVCVCKVSYNWRRRFACSVFILLIVVLLAVVLDLGGCISYFAFDTCIFPTGASCLLLLFLGCSSVSCECFHQIKLLSILCYLELVRMMALSMKKAEIISISHWEHISISYLKMFNHSTFLETIRKQQLIIWPQM